MPSTLLPGALALCCAFLLGCNPALSETSSELREPVQEQRFGDLSRLAMGRTDKGPEKHHFTEIYEHILFPLRNEELLILEIGVARGGSLLMWQEYFPKARICGVDIHEKPQFNNERVRTLVADQAERDQLAQAVEDCGGPYDFILDDGGHEMHQQQISLGFLFEHVKPGGYYILEDVHTSLRNLYPNFGANEDGSNATLAMIEHFFRTGKIVSEYMTPEEMAYVSENVEYCNLYCRNNERHSMTAIFKKRAE